MDPRILRYYEQELAHLREMGAEFAREHPKVASRLALEGLEVADPYVERLLEGVAFLAARVQVKLDAEFPRLTQRLLEIIYPNFLAPMPAMLVARFEADLNDPSLQRGVVVKRGSTLLKPAAAIAATGSERTAAAANAPIRFRTAGDLTLWPVEGVEAAYFSYQPDLPITSLPVGPQVRSGIRLKLRATAGLDFSQIAMDTLRLHLTGNDETAFRLHELMLGAPLGVAIAPAVRPWPTPQWLPASSLAAVGFGDDEALLPVTPRVFQGFRLLQEYFALPQRFLFVDVKGLRPALARLKATDIEVVLLFARADPRLENVVDGANFATHCIPAINLFSRRADRIHVTEGTHEYHVVPDRVHPMDYEVYEVRGVTGYSAGTAEETHFLPFYATYHHEPRAHPAYFSVQREPRVLSEKQRRVGTRSSYIGSEVFVSLVDAAQAPFAGSLRQLSVETLCTNRDLPLRMPLGDSGTHFLLDQAVPVKAVRVLKGPSRPFSPVWERGAEWKLVNSLAANYLTLLDTDDRQGAASLRALLDLYAATADAGTRRQIEGVRSVAVEPIVRRLPAPGPITFGRGLRVSVEVDELAFQGASAFLFGSVLERVFGRHVSINAFTETVLRSPTRGEIKRWMPRWGDRAIV